MLSNIQVSYYPFSVGWAITNQCNLHCKHCNMNSGKKSSDELTVEECCRIIDELAKENVQKIMFSGGEPLTRNDFFEIVDYAISKGIFVSLTTNGLLLNSKIIEQQFYKFELVRVSLDGANSFSHEYLRNQSNLFERTVNNIKLLVSYGIDVAVVTCVSKVNISELEEIAKLLKKLKVKKWFLPLLSPAGRGMNIKDKSLSPLQVKDFLLNVSKIVNEYDLDVRLDIPYSILIPEISDKQKQLESCPAAITEMMIFANGDVSPCCQVPIIGGNYKKDNIKKVWKSAKIFVDFRNKSKIKGNCGKCEHLLSCGGCRANAYIKYGDYLEGDDLCWKS